MRATGRTLAESYLEHPPYEGAASRRRPIGPRTCSRGSSRGTRVVEKQAVNPPGVRRRNGGGLLRRLSAAIRALVVNVLIARHAQSPESISFWRFAVGAAGPPAVSGARARWRAWRPQLGLVVGAGAVDVLCWFLGIARSAPPRPHDRAARRRCWCPGSRCCAGASVSMPRCWRCSPRRRPHRADRCAAWWRRGQRAARRDAGRRGFLDRIGRALCGVHAGERAAVAKPRRRPGDHLPDGGRGDRDGLVRLVPAAGLADRSGARRSGCSISAWSPRRWPCSPSAGRRAPEPTALTVATLVGADDRGGAGGASARPAPEPRTVDRRRVARGEHLGLGSARTAGDHHALARDQVLGRSAHHG